MPDRTPADYNKARAKIFKRYNVAVRLILLFSLLLAVAVVVAAIVLFVDSPAANQREIIIIIVVAACAVTSIAVLLSCLHSAKKRALINIEQLPHVRRQQPNRPRVRCVKTASSAGPVMDTPPPYDSLFDIRGMSRNSTFNSPTAIEYTVSVSDINCTSDGGGTGDSGGCTSSSAQD